jgi:hypothetical protein
MDIRKIIKEEVSDFEWADDVTPLSSRGLDWDVRHENRGASMSWDEISKEFGDKIKNELMKWHHHSYTIDRVGGYVNVRKEHFVFRERDRYKYSVDIDIVLTSDSNDGKLVNYNGNFLGLFDNPDNYWSSDDLSEEESLIEYIHPDRPTKDFDPKMITSWMTNVLYEYS